MRVKPLLVLPLLVVLFIGQAWIHKVRIYPFCQENFAPRRDSDYSQLSPDQMLLALARFREMIAGQDCGLRFVDWAGFKQGDIVEAFRMVQVN